VLTRRDVLKAAFAGAAAAGLTGCRAFGARPKPPPNVLVVLADDQGWGDLSLHDGSTPTPNLDRFFRSSVELTTFMTCPVCSPTRAGLLTGRHHLRLGAGPMTGGELDPGEVTLAEAFAANGYATGVFGKWHNGRDPDTPEFRAAFETAWKEMPNKKPVFGHGANAHGFHEAWVYYGGGADYFSRRTVKGRGPVSWWHNREFRPADQGYTDDLITRRAVEFLRAHRSRPFLCYVPFHLVHSPLQAKPEALARVPAQITDKAARTYAAMLISLDDSVGVLLGELETLGLAENTIMLFFSDNGATPVGSNLPLRGGKHSTWEGGIHSPAAIRWPAGKLTGPRRYDGLMGHLDVYPTLMAMAGLDLPRGRPLDGRNLWPALRDGTPSPVGSYYWVWDDHDVVRTADWKLVRYVDRVELFDMRRDLRETTDVAARNPAAVKELTAMLDTWRRSTGVALMHQPPRLAAEVAATPEGQVLEFRVTQTKPVAPRKALLVQFAHRSMSVRPGDYVEFDICIAEDSLTEGFYYTPFKRGKAAAFTPRRGVDQLGRLQARGPGTRGGPGVWEHRVVGLASLAPGALGLHGMVFNSRKAGTFHIYLDNLRVRHADGSAEAIWTGGEHTRFRVHRTDAAFRDIAVRAVPLAQARPTTKRG